jgi:hypothetical protein
MPLVAPDGKPPASTDTSTSDDHPRHHMLTRARAGVFKPNPRYSHTVSTAAISPIPKSARAALQDPNWFAAMQAELVLYEPMRPGHWCHGLLVSMLSVESGFFVTSLILMAPLILNAPALILVTHLAQW